MKKLLTLIALALPFSAHANTVAETELLNAQNAYRETLSEYNRQFNQSLQLREHLHTAETKLTTLQQEIEQLRVQLNAAEQTQHQSQQLLNDAGERLDRAWRAVRNH